jgi:hypothetical protein
MAQAKGNVPTSNYVITKTALHNTVKYVFGFRRVKIRPMDRK